MHVKEFVSKIAGVSYVTHKRLKLFQANLEEGHVSHHWWIIQCSTAKQKLQRPNTLLPRPECNLYQPIIWKVVLTQCRNQVADWWRQSECSVLGCT